ncbi:Stalked cell differentiation-controlling protein [Thiorhodovibrio winogradskyi]|uniref:diguanylate cyclase n=1 Tax=Thiorhodovibrio winogradskyi TaxID=77007 RepID=A0ABZ0SIP0_9GAMM|nr:diguanylate cyclase [Thiorhodovibrio winogradskyi]
MNTNNAKGIEQAFHRYLDAYFCSRDLKATLARLSPGFTGIGTGRDETVLTPGKAESVYRRDIKQAPNPIHYRFHRPPHIQIPKACLGLVCAELDIETTVLEQRLILRHLRLTMVFVRQDSDWLIEHMHISLPTQAHDEDESYPVRELENRTQWLERRVAEKTQALQQAVDEIAHLATTDRLTGLSNRLKLDDYLDEAIKRAERQAEPLSLILLDLDHFKQVNDTHGHLHGDRILAEFSRLLSTSIHNTCLLGRWGGEEFLLICPGLTLEAAVDHAEGLREAVRRHAFPGLGRPQTASFGVACHRAGESSEHLIARADMALYRAKRSGRDRVETSEETDLPWISANTPL